MSTQFFRWYGSTRPLSILPAACPPYLPDTMVNPATHGRAAAAEVSISARRRQVHNLRFRTAGAAGSMIRAFSRAAPHESRALLPIAAAPLVHDVKVCHSCVQTRWSAGSSSCAGRFARSTRVLAQALHQDNPISFQTPLQATRTVNGYPVRVDSKRELGAPCSEHRACTETTGSGHARGTSECGRREQGRCQACG